MEILPEDWPGLTNVTDHTVVKSKHEHILFCRPQKRQKDFKHRKSNMTDQIYNSYPPELSDEQRDYLIQVVKDWSIQHSLTYRPHPSFVSDEINKYHTLATNAPITLFPSPFPKSCFDQARDLQTVYNELYAAIADDEEWLEEMIQE